jgi:hypothetical protein
MMLAMNMTERTRVFAGIACICAGLTRIALDHDLFFLRGGLIAVGVILAIQAV